MSIEIEFSVKKFMEGLSVYLDEKFDKVAENFMKALKRQRADGKRSWSTDMKNTIDIIEKTFDKDGLTVEVGYNIEEDDGNNEWMRAMVIEYGIGRFRSRPPKKRIWHIPNIEVWDSTLTGRKTARPTPAYPIPQLKQHGNKTLESAVIDFTQEFNDAVDDILANVPESVYDNAITVKES